MAPELNETNDTSSQKNDTTVPGNEQHEPQHDENKHESWIVHAAHVIEEKIEETLGHINADFPLSGGETEEDFQRVEHSK